MPASTAVSLTTTEPNPDIPGHTAHDSVRTASLTVLAFVVANLVARGLFVGLNTGEYTDGILQLSVFTIPAGLYPPLYGALAWWVSQLGIDLVIAGRVVSIIAASLTVIPVYAMTRRAFGESAARFSAVFFTISPIVWRWSLRAMTDSLFLCAGTFAIHFMMCSGENRDSRKRADRFLALASLLTAASALTRYQGAFLGLLLVIPLFQFVRNYRSLPWRSVLASMAWVALPLWIKTNGFVHTSQFESRTAGQWLATLLAYWNLAESFVLISPYYFAYPIFACFLIGLFRVRSTARVCMKPFLAYWGIWALVLLVLQSLFGSFQYRYMMPLLPAVLVLAGGGAAWFEADCLARGRRWMFSALFAVGLLYTLLMAVLVVVKQHEAFGDQRRAALFVREQFPGARNVYSNERYGEFLQLGCVKLSYWRGARVEPLWDFLPPKPGLAPRAYFPNGSLVILGTAYGEEHVDSILSELNYFYHIRHVAAFSSMLYPLHDDIMMNGMFSQNPMGWVMRYAAQLFSTTIYVVDSRRTDEEIQALINRQLGPPGTKPVSDGRGGLMVDGSGLTTATATRARP
ncbi:MAG: glycosyltransferase family 39 protein [Candidatus Sumerlaeaceae bacterium]|nr:glycosyltransferase family 39 protein [Candidatus Sumerlaeaceae bacterium]